MFTFKSTTNLSPLTVTDLPLASLQHFLNTGMHWCELGARLGTEQVVHTRSKAKVMSLLLWCGRRLGWHNRARQKLQKTVWNYSWLFRLHQKYKDANLLLCLEGANQDLAHRQVSGWLILMYVKNGKIAPLVCAQCSFMIYWTVLFFCLNYSLKKRVEMGHSYP